MPQIKKLLKKCSGRNKSGTLVILSFDEMDQEFEGGHLTQCPDWNLIQDFLQYVLPKPLDEVKLTFGNINRKIK